jgi:hypothetical protein
MDGHRSFIEGARLTSRRRMLGRLPDPLAVAAAQVAEPRHAGDPTERCGGVTSLVSV